MLTMSRSQQTLAAATRGNRAASVGGLVSRRSWPGARTGLPCRAPAVRGGIASAGCMARMYEPLMDDDAIRKLWIGETELYREHLLRLDPESRRNWFGGAVSESAGIPRPAR
jgi:hypothetical protein